MALALARTGKWQYFGYYCLVASVVVLGTSVFFLVLLFHQRVMDQSLALLGLDFRKRAVADRRVHLRNAQINAIVSILPVT